MKTAESAFRWQIIRADTSDGSKKRGRVITPLVTSFYQNTCVEKTAEQADHRSEDQNEFRLDVRWAKGMTMKNMKRRMISKLAMVLAAVFCFSAAWVSAETIYLYQPKFAGNGTSSNSVGLTGATSNLLSTAGWKANYTVSGTVQKTTQGQTNEFVQGATALLTQISVSGNVMRNTNALLWTENFAVTNVDVQKLSEVMFYQGNTTNTTRPRLALRVGGNWYASVNIYSNQSSTANLLQRTTLTAADLAAMDFYSLTFVSGSSLVLGSSPVAFSTLSGAVDAAGIYYDTTSSGSGAYVRLREFTVATSIQTLTVNGGSGSGSYSPGTQVEISANTTTSRTFAAWIGDTNVLSSNTVNTTFTMPTNAVTLTATYDLTSLTVNSGTGGGLYTSGANVAITASNIPGKFFVAWTGATQYVASATSTTTTVTVPVQDIALTAKYTLLYQPNVAGNANSNSLGYGTGASSNQLLSNAGWKAHYTTSGTAQPTTQAQTNEFVQGTAALLTQCSVTTDPLRSQKAILWTENFAVTNVDVQKLSEVMFYQQNATNLTIPRLALRVGGNWYASVNTYQAQTNNALERTTLAATNLAAMNFYSLNFIPGSSLVLDTGSNTAFSVLSGAVSAAGLYYDDTSTEYVRLRELTVTTAASTLTVTGGSGSGSYNPGAQVAISANTTTSRNFVAWIGDTQCVDNVTSSNATVTMLSSTVSLTATYDLASLTVNSGTGDGLYTSGANVAITASDVPGKIFVAWTGATQYVASVTSATTTVTVPVQDIDLTATYTAAILYQPNVAGNANSNSLGHGGVTTNYLLSNVSWKANYTVNGTAQPATQAQTNEFVQASAALLTQCSVSTDPLRGTNALLWTENFATNNVDVQNLTEVMFYQNNDLTSTVSRLALRVGGNWYASANTYQQAVAAARERTTLESTNLAAMTFYSLAFTPDSTLLLNTGSPVAFSDLSGAVDAAGLYYDNTSTDYVRLREFTVQSAHYMLTVNNGTGGGVYTPAAQVAISATAIAGKTFVAWTGDTAYVDNANSASATVTMPAQAIALTATYTDTTYALTVTSGSGSASYTNGHQVGISATVIGGKTFVAWTGDTAYVDNASSASATVTMPAQAVNLTATYTDTTYALTVTSGTGGGSYTNGHQVAISADAPASGYAFVAWTGDTEYVDNAGSASATITMPPQAVNVTATYVATEQYTTNAIPVPYSWLDGYGITNNQNAAVLLDPDGDGLTTEQEYIAGTVPTNAASVLKATQATRNVITWIAQSNRTYSVYWSTNLVQGFTALNTNIVSPQSSYTNTSPNARVNHYQIKVRME